MPNTMSNPLDQKEYFLDTALQVKNFGSNTVSMFGGVKTSDVQAENKYASMSLQDYIDFCRAYLGANFLTEAILQQRLAYLREAPDLKEHLRAGNRVCVVPIPCSENGFELEPAEIGDGLFLRNLVLNAKDQAVEGFSKSGCNIFKLLPLEIRDQLVFTVPLYQNGDDGEITAADREKILKLYEDKFRAAQILFLGDLSK